MSRGQHNTERARTAGCVRVRVRVRVRVYACRDARDSKDHTVSGAPLRPPWRRREHQRRRKQPRGENQNQNQNQNHRLFRFILLLLLLEQSEGG